MRSAETKMRRSRATGSCSQRTQRAGIFIRRASRRRAGSQRERRTLRVVTHRQLRATRQRAAVVALLESVDGFRSAQELYDELRQRGENIGLTTVYRNLQALAAAGLVDMVRNDTGESVYRRCSTGDHHHHLVCRVCGKAVEVEGPAVEKWADICYK